MVPTELALDDNWSRWPLRLGVGGLAPHHDLGQWVHHRLLHVDNQGGGMLLVDHGLLLHLLVLLLLCVWVDELGGLCLLS